ncbi:unnamed protein product [Caenorhabditis brenneri]
MAPKRKSTKTPRVLSSEEERIQRNKKEKRRTSEIRQAFNRLRRSLTCVPMNHQAKTSQIQCLELAMAYISYLQKVLRQPENASSCPLSDTVCNILNGRRSYADRAKEEQLNDTDAT